MEKKQQLVLSPDFQRGSVWDDGAKSYLIDTILNDYPIPQVFFRTSIDAISQRTIREVVDGQQRLRSILAFAAGELRISSKSKSYAGMTYRDLSEGDKQKFLAFEVPTVQLIIAEDDRVLEVFARLNSYSVRLNAAELRHAMFVEPIKWVVHDTANKWSSIWNELGVCTLRERVRLRHCSIMAEMFMIVDVGFGNAGEANITKYYKMMKDKPEDYFDSLIGRIDDLLDQIRTNLGDDFKGTPVFSAPNFLALFAACGLLVGAVPKKAAAEGIALPKNGIDWLRARKNLRGLAMAFDDEVEDTGQYRAFIEAAKSSTHRLQSRRTRLEFLVKQISNEAFK